jgi:L-threonylcarbamoyladenylate synthase
VIISKDCFKIIISELRKGELLILPTDTLYALACDASNTKAVEKVYKLKQRLEQKALPILCSDIEQVEKIVKLEESGYRLAQYFWPGKLTLILERKKNQSIISNKVYGKNSDIAIRVPKSDFIIQIIKELGAPLVGTSANISGKDPVFNAKEAELHFKSKVIVVDGGIKQCPPSSIVKINHNNFQIIREGEITITALKKAYYQ